MLGIGDRLVVLLVGPSGGDEDHLVEVEGRLDLARRDQVSVVDGVEGAAHDTDRRVRSAISVAVRDAFHDRATMAMVMKIESVMRP